MSTHDTGPEKAEPAAQGDRRPYSKPRLQILGTIPELTAAGSGGTPEAFNGTKTGP